MMMDNTSILMYANLSAGEKSKMRKNNDSKTASNTCNVRKMVSLNSYMEKEHTLFTNPTAHK